MTYGVDRSAGDPRLGPDLVVNHRDSGQNGFGGQILSHGRDAAPKLRLASSSYLCHCPSHPPSDVSLPKFYDGTRGLFAKRLGWQVRSKSSPVAVTLSGFAERSHTCSAPRRGKWGFSVLQDATLCVGHVPN